MTKRVEAVYENGVLRPLQPLPLAEDQLVSVMVSDSAGDPLVAMIDQAFVDSACAEVAAAGRVPTHEEIRRITSRDTSSWAEAIVKGREERFDRRTTSILNSVHLGSKLPSTRPTGESSFRA